ncbi:MAG: polysaccharide biosynthesis protein [Actinobacteria bacterium]|nr:MAG: polysaccharide biosynthesis protein [Actinomycetota bacterium]
MRRLLAVLPPGTLAVGAGLVVLGAASYVQLAVAGHALSHQRYDALSVLWAIVFSLGFGLFFPIEQEVTRLIAARRVTGDGSTPVFRRGMVLSGVLLAAVCVLLAVGTPWIGDVLFGGDRRLVLVLAGGFVAVALCYPTRGVLAGTRRFGGYGVQLGTDGGLRILLTALLGVLGVHATWAYGLILTVAPLISVAITTPAVLAGLSAGTALAWSVLRRGIGPLLVSTLLAQLVVNIAVINVKLLAPHAVALAGGLLSALVLVRIPLFVFASLQASLLPGLAGAASAGDRPGFRRLLLRGCAIVTVLAVLGAVVAVPLGPWLLRVFFAVGGVVGSGDFAILAAGTGAYLLAQVLGQGAIALGHHRDQTLAWLAGTTALVAITLMPGDVRLRVEAGYAVGSAVVALILALAVARRSLPPEGTLPPPATALAAIGGVE